MGETWRVRLQELLAEADMVREGLKQVPLIEEAIRLADAHNDLDAGFSARLKLVHAAVAAGIPDKAVVAFSWCIARYKQDDRRFNDSRFMWYFKWIALELPYFTDLSQAQITHILDEMAFVYKAEGRSLRPVYQQRMNMTIVLGGDPEEAREHYAQWQSGLNDLGCDCRACEQSCMVDYHVFMGDMEAALQTAEPILKGRMSCWQVPQMTWAVLLMEVYDTGRRDLTDRWYSEGVKRTRHRDDMLYALGRFAQYAAVTGELGRATELVEAHLGKAYQTRAGLRRLNLLLGAHGLASKLAQAGETRIKLRLPESCPHHHPQHLYDPVALDRKFLNEIKEIVESADRRTGRPTYLGQLQGHLARFAL